MLGKKFPNIKKFNIEARRKFYIKQKEYTNVRLSLKLMSFNSRSIIKRKDKLLQYMIENDLDVAAIQETWINNKNSDVKFKGYKIIKTPPSHISNI